MNRPILTNNLFEDNSAAYGPNIGSYPVKIIEVLSRNTSIKIDEVPSGLLYGQKLIVNVVDFDGQIVNNENSKTVKLSPITFGAFVGGTDYAKITNGTADFDNLIFRYMIGTPGVMYSLTSSAIDHQIVNRILNESNSRGFSNTIEVNFRNCKPGEKLTSTSQCEE
jgi:hypothetical protein